MFIYINNSLIELIYHLFTLYLKSRIQIILLTSTMVSFKSLTSKYIY